MNASEEVGNFSENVEINLSFQTFKGKGEGKNKTT